MKHLDDMAVRIIMATAMGVVSHYLSRAMYGSLSKQKQHK